MSTNNTRVKAMPAHRKISLTAGILYLLTFVSIPTLTLYSTAKSSGYITGTSSDTAALMGILSEIIVALAGIGTAVVLFAVLKKQNETLAIGLIASRVLEAASIFVGTAVILTLVSLKQANVGSDALVVGQTLVSLYDRIFLVSQSFLPGINDLLLGILLYKSRLVPKAIALIGIVGGPMIIASLTAVILGVIALDSPIKGVSAIGVALFELTLGIWLVAKGFNPKAVAALDKKPTAS
ncbi:MAG: DUF4386 domain-containing protein [Candidatus Saccharimonadales bacterium]